MQELKINELEQVSGGFLPALAAGAIILVAGWGYNDGRTDKYR
ncbi:MAG: class IIb bacteriocin, lactobin A/cerein 7B family [Neisseria sp.]|jgi:class IIb bacteriocin, lactobin A/cerein 7B family|uniref:Class IIb bacteriocin, lactobin A/cerein 7B family n=1 Tax=Neisseria oralis TaxID=1107316 RepID=A0ABW8Q1Z8_9NEIS